MSLRDAVLQELRPDIAKLVREEVARALAKKRSEPTTFSLTSGARYKRTRTARLHAALVAKELPAEFKPNGGVGSWRISKAALDGWKP